MQILRIGMVGSRKLTPIQYKQFEALAYALAKSGYGIRSGGCPQGADQAAADGVNRWNEGKSLHLFLDPFKHKKNKYPRLALCYYKAKDDPETVALARRHADDHQWSPAYRGYFIRNAAIAMNSDLLIAWRSGDSRGTNHTLMCGRELNVPCLLVDKAYGTAPWTTADELIERVLVAIERLKERIA